MNAIEIEEKRSAGDDVRRLTTMYLELCGCNGPQPAMGAPLARLHDEACEYRIRIEEEQRAEAEREARSR
jgi:hypothetical protein